MKIKNLIIIFAFLFLISFVSAESDSDSIEDFIELDDYIIDYSYDIPEAGDKFSLTVTLTNNGNSDKNNVIFEINDNTPFDIIGDDKWTIGTLTQDEEVTKNFRFEVDDDAFNDDYELEFNLDDSEDDYEDYFTIEVESNLPELVIGDLRSEPITIIPDKEDIKFTIDLQNIGDGDAKFVRATLTLPNGFSNSNSFSDIANLGTIVQGETKEAIFYIDTDENLNSDSYQTSLLVEYKDENNNQKTETLYFNIPVKGIPQFKIQSVISQPSQLFAGETVNLKIKVKNIGQEEAKETSIKVFEKTDFPFSFEEKTNYIGNIASDSSGTATFEMEVEKDALSKIYLLNIQIRTISEGNVIVTEETISLEVTEETKESFNIVGFAPYILLMLIVLVVVLLILISIRRN